MSGRREVDTSAVDDAMRSDRALLDNHLAFTALHRPAAEAQGITSGPLWQRITSLILSIDGERHHRQRRLVAKAFTQRRVEQLRGRW